MRNYSKHKILLPEPRNEIDDKPIIISFLSGRLEQTLPLLFFHQLLIRGGECVREEEEVEEKGKRKKGVSMKLGKKEREKWGRGSSKKERPCEQEK